MWNKWLIIELVIISRNEVKKTVVFKTCGPDSRLVFRRRTVYSSLYFRPWLKNCLNSVYNVFFDMWWTHWYTIFKISLWQTRYKALKGTVPPKLLNLEQMTSWVSCQLSFLFSTYCFYNLWSGLKIKQCIMDKVILSDIYPLKQRYPHIFLMLIL